MFTNRLWLFVRGDNGQVYSITSANGLSWPQGAWENVAPEAIGGWAPYEAIPHVIGLQNQLIMAVTGNDRQVYFKMSEDGIDWVPWMSIGSSTVNSAPSLVVSGETVFLFERGMDTKIYFKEGWLE